MYVNICIYVCIYIYICIYIYVYIYDDGNTDDGITDNSGKDTNFADIDKFDKFLEENNIMYTLHLLKFLKSKKMFIFIRPPDTTGFTQLLDQVRV